MLFHTLHSALVQIPATDIVVAQDLSSAGQKCFLRGSISALDDIYSKQTDKHWYECLLENRPSRIFLDVESLTKVDIQTIVDLCRQAIQCKFGITATMEILDSCSASKFSWHVLCTNLYLKNIYHVGAFVRRLVLSMSGHPYRHAIDTAVYTRNRMFRVADSSKFGSERILKHPSGTWSDLLVQSSGATYVECKEIDGGEPSSTSLHPDKMFRLVHGQWTRTTFQNRRLVESAGTTCPMLTPIIDWLDTHVAAQTCRHNMSLSTNGQYRISTRSKRCAIAGREHKGNNIWFNIDLNRCVVQQRCYDDECRSQAVYVSVPAKLWSLWNDTWAQVIHAPRNENTLFNMSP